MSKQDTNEQDTNEQKVPAMVQYWTNPDTVHAINHLEGLVALFHSTKQVSKSVAFKVPTTRLKEEAEQGASYMMLGYMSAQIRALSQHLEAHLDQPTNQRYLRLHLILEEVSELAQALADSDKELALDAICDLLYVVIGTAVTWNLPLGKAFDRVHQSNMTKAPCEDSDYRLRNKGSCYRPPNLKEIL